jgi:peptidoglycan/LPS O-acetylase OafA/YrhL
VRPLPADPAAAQRTGGSRASVRQAAPAYRPDIDGLRAVAVTLVIAYHALPKLVLGGFTGVDVFFVISGYLITQLVLSGLQQGTFSLGWFYQRRVRRIVPALLVVLTVCVVLAWLTLLPGEFRWLGQSILWTAPFLANVFFAHVSGYFDPDKDSNLLLHLWSLGVEEQFYLAWPILLMLAVRFGVTVPVLWAVTATSFAISLWGARYAPLVHFFLPGSRVWELAVGGLLAARQCAAHPVCATRASSPESRRGWSGMQLNSVAGAALIGAGALLLSADNTFPGGWGAIPVAGAALLIGAGPQASVNRQFLGSRPLVFVGRLSYSLYLWHWPMFAFARLIWGRELPPAALALVVALAFLAAFATYRLVELPLRYSVIGRRAVPALLGGLMGFTLLGAAMAWDRIPPRLSGPEFVPWDKAVRDWQVTNVGSVDEGTGVWTLTLRSHRAATALFIGDSHLLQYWPRVTYLIDSQPDAARSARFAASAGCPILPGLNSLRRPRNCAGFFDFATREAFRPEVDTVVFGACWELYVLGEYSIERREGVYSSKDLLRSRLQLDSRATQVALEQFERLLARLTSSGRRVFIVASNPTSPRFDPPSLVPPRVRLSLHLPRIFVVHDRQVDAAPFESFVAPLMDRFREIAARTHARVIDPRSTLCAGMSCPAVGPDGLPLYLDTNHVRATYARERAAFLDETLLAPQVQ